MRIVFRGDVPFAEKPEGTSVHYYLFNDYEVHYNEQAPRTTQTWHHHEVIGETLYVFEGKLIAKWRDEGGEQSQIIAAGDLVETDKVPHTFENASDQVVKFIVFKRIPSDQDHRQTFKQDKILD